MKTPTPEIRKALYRHLTCALPLACGITESDIAWPNVPFRPASNRPYVSPFCLFAETEAAALSKSGFERLSGVFQVSVYGVLSTGESALEEIARELVELYRGGTALDVPGWSPLRILKAYRKSLQIETGGDQLSRETPRPLLVVSANWIHYVTKGE